ncbi:arsenate reductase/protein-tyrosine-phosphatase family protein [Brachybacterium hainanense]|uniref:Low molecular weight phosphatase family protein n=1 Tax=Brachybacterium hainanense TaxID=1541174 RepID=A0ABV6RA13_9MICO
MSTLLVVCTANICRSPVAEAALGRALSGTGITVRSAGTRAVPAAPASPETAALLRERFGQEQEHRAHVLTASLAASADLVLTMTVPQRGQVIALEPRTVRRVFTLRELARILPRLPEAAPAGEEPGLRSLAQRCARLRAAEPLPVSALDIEDPYGGTPAAYRMAFAQILEASGIIGAGLAARLRGREPA